MSTSIGQVSFRVHSINPDSRYEAGCAFDVNNDGRPDIHCGGFWYEAPEWKRHAVREIKEEGGYYHDLASLPIDVDGDGWTDVVTAAWHNQQVAWVRNPGSAGGRWETIAIDQPGYMETAILADINGDERPDVVPNVVKGTPRWYEVRSEASAKHGVTWIKHELPAELAGDGIGAGDIDGDGDTDLVGCKGWAEAPKDASAAEAKWTWHAEFDLIDPGIPILVHDVDGDGDADLIWGIGHDYGVYWLEQERNGVGQRVWSRHEIDRGWSQAHVTLLGDLDGDGSPELLTGKRFHAHNGKDPGGNEPRCLYWYDFNRQKRQWTRHTIHEGGQTGTGTTAQLIDIDQDGDLDFIAPGKSGLYLLENQRR